MIIYQESETFMNDTDWNLLHRAGQTVQPDDYLKIFYATN